METKCEPWGWACTTQGRTVKVMKIILGSEPRNRVRRSHLPRALGSIRSRADRSVFALLSPDFSATPIPLFPWVFSDLSSGSGSSPWSPRGWRCLPGSQYWVLSRSRGAHPKP